MFSWMYVFLIWFVEYIDKFKEFKCRMLYVFDKIDKCYYIFIIIFCIMIYIVKIYLIFFWYIDMIICYKKFKGNCVIEYFKISIIYIWDYFLNILWKLYLMILYYII